MSFLHDKHVRNYCVFLVLLFLFVFLAWNNMLDRQAAAAKEILLAHENAIAASLLEQGISKQVIAAAFTNTEGNASAGRFLAQIGLSENTDADRLSYVSTVKSTVQMSMSGFLFVWAALMSAGTVRFLRGRERLYKKSERMIKDCIDGNGTACLPQAEEGAVYQMLSSVEQLTAILRSKNDAERKTKEFLRNTISDISHQLKTPLSALMMYQEIIAAEPDHPDTVKEFSEKMGTALKRIEQLIWSMLKITRLDAGSIVFEKGHYSISDIVRRAVSELTTRADNENKEIMIEGSFGQTLFCDMEWTSEAVGNIVKNALDHTDAGGKIHISWERTPVMIRILIKDNGHGIAPEDIHHIFKRFYRSKNALETQGIGLGLPLAKAMIEGQGGMISVQSARMHGTAFTLSFLTES